ncbi:hypothetical protein CDL12_09978 [Handroanthus impetiginosus]|uniref:Alginate lyase 2 domain-containing protein n=1 Tax=Handroanthus impetiginosus TaxID=429701 RepID=A0A2G9HIJ6_9LAMI|nr:hypothetical protein CDL12_09978 [Handroanthus impetiginosus]
MASFNLSSCLHACFLLQTLYRVVGSGPIDPTEGFISQHLNKSNLVIQRPHDVPENQRYSFKSGTDKPHTPTSETNPRTEIRIRPFNLPIDHRYSFIYGVHKLWMYSNDRLLSPNSPTKPGTEVIINFEAYGYVPCGTSGICIMQIFGADPPNATIPMLRVYNGTLSYYRAPVILPNIYDKWFKLNVIHDIEKSKIKRGVYHYFKCGVYAQNDYSYYMESRWKNIRILKKSG